MLSNKNKKVCTTLNYIEHFVTLVFAVTVCISISAFAFSKRNMTSSIGLNIFEIITGIKRYKSITKKTKKKRDEITLLAKTNLDCIKGLISRSSTDSYTDKDYFLLIDVLIEYDDMIEEIKKLEKNILIKQCHCIV